MAGSLQQCNKSGAQSPTGEQINKLIWYHPIPFMHPKPNNDMYYSNQQQDHPQIACFALFRGIMDCYMSSTHCWFGPDIRHSCWIASMGWLRSFLVNFPLFHFCKASLTSTKVLIQNYAVPSYCTLQMVDFCKLSAQTCFYLCWRAGSSHFPCRSRWDVMALDEFVYRLALEACATW